MSSEAELVTAELFKADQQHDLGMRTKANGDELWIRCPYHGGGRERTPSMRITISEGSSFFLRAKCHGCGKFVHYNDIAEVYGLMKTDKNFKAIGVKGLNFRNKIEKRIATEEGRDFKLSTFDWPRDRDWRTIPGSVVIKNKGVLTDTRHDLEEPRLAFPVTVWKETKGYVYALLHDPKRDATGKKVEIAYINSPGPWKEQCVFGFDRARLLLKKFPNYPLWLVEGPRDRLWLEAGKCIAVSTLGSSFSEEKAQLIKILNPHRLLVATDNDEAGNKLAAEVHDYLERSVPLTRIKWKEGQDPCDVTHKRLRKINERYLSHAIAA